MTPRDRSPVRLLAVATLLASGCSGSIVPDGESSNPPSMVPPGPGAPGQPSGGPPPGGQVSTTPPEAARPFSCTPNLRGHSPARLRRLSGVQFANTIKSLPGLAKASFQNPLLGADGNERFTSYAKGQGLPDALATGVLDTSATVAPAVVAALKSTSPCLAAPDAACLKGALGTLGAKAFRRPLVADELDRLVALVTSNQASLGAQLALELGVRAMLVSPHFAFRTELGDGPADASGLKRLSGWELASALSYTLADGPPDEPLIAAAGKGELSTTDQIRAHATRLLGAPANNGVLARFFREYFHYDRATEVFKDAKLVPHHAPAELVADTDAFVREVLSARKETLKNLLGASWGMARAKTVGSYGLAAMTGSAVQRMEFPSGQRAGMLTQPSFLTAFSHADENDPIRRGKFIAQSLLCIGLPDTVPDNVPPLPETPNATLRERLSVHVNALPSCKACHAIMDPLGLGLEGYDHTGRHRTTELGRPVDTRGAIVGTGTGLDGSYDGAVELGAKLAGSPLVEACFVRHATRFLLGRSEIAEDSCSMAAAQEALRRSGGDVGEMVLSLVTSDSFLHRKPL